GTGTGTGTMLVHGPTLRSERDPSASVRELPRISVELRGTPSDAEDGEPQHAIEGDHERDLEVLGLLGEGGMGRVFLARQHSLNREVAIKTVRHRAGETEREALLSEGAIVGYLEHPGVVPVHALGVDEEGRPVLVMKRVEGAPWSELLGDPAHHAWTYLGGEARDRLDGHVAILMQVCNAVEFAHSRGVLHRDIKPQNVLIGRYGEVYLADWGLAVRLDAAAQVLPLCGTPQYMAPEMVVGTKLDARTDVYLLGATLHQILTGTPRHGGSTLGATLQAAGESKPVDYPATIPAALARLANAATALLPDDRPATAASVREALADYVRHRSSIELAESGIERLGRLQTMMKDAESLASADRQREIDVLGAETAFALAQALREWKENPVALRGSAELDALLGSRRSRAAQLERFAREHDPGVASVPRAVAAAALALVGAALSLSSLFVDGAGVTVQTLFDESLAPFSLVAIGAFALRRQFLRTILNRRVAAAMLSVTALIMVNRALGLASGATAAQVLVFDCLGIAAWCALCAVLFFRWLVLPGVLALVAAVVAAADPGRAFSAFSAASGLGLLAGAYFGWKTARDAARTDGSGKV
ncbi:MAG TPA: serine/threonine-protein kinase, partial [Polyangiaceae bacterium]